jgi:hypothetical protein
VQSIVKRFLASVFRNQDVAKDGFTDAVTHGGIAATLNIGAV